AVERDVERSDGDLDALGAGDPLTDPAGEVDAAGGDPEEHQLFGALVALEDLVRDAGQRPVDVGSIENGTGGRVVRRRGHRPQTSFSASRDGSLKDVEALGTLAAVDPVDPLRPPS